MSFVSLSQVAERFSGKTVAIVGSGPGSLDNAPGFVDSHDVVVRVNNYKTGLQQGFRCDVHYSFYGTSIRKTAEELKADGVALCMCKCPNAKALECEWHERMGKQVGIDYRYIYRNRVGWWFCDVVLPSVERYRGQFEMLDKHIPTTGFSAVLDVLDCNPASVYLTGFDFFISGVHNVDERWKPGDPQDPICHRPDLESAWVKANAHRFTFDKKLVELLTREQAR